MTKIKNITAHSNQGKFAKGFPVGWAVEQPLGAERFLTSNFTAFRSSLAAFQVLRSINVISCPAR